MKQLVVFFSRRGVNYAVGNISEGNAEHIAKVIQKLTNSDIFEIKSKKEYPSNYSACTKEALKEYQNDARPELIDDIDISQYEVIYLCYPNWWGSFPRPVATFLSKHDFQNKIIMPMCTHEGSKMGNSLVELKRLLPKSIIKEGLPIKGTEARNSDEEIENWIKKIFHNMNINSLTYAKNEEINLS